MARSLKKAPPPVYCSVAPNNMRPIARHHRLDRV
jgi:hypothetical protein